MYRPLGRSAQQQKNTLFRSGIKISGQADHSDRAQLSLSPWRIEERSLESDLIFEITKESAILLVVPSPEIEEILGCTLSPKYLTKGHCGPVSWNLKAHEIKKLASLEEPPSSLGKVYLIRMEI